MANERPTIVVTTNILGDVVENLVGDGFDVVTIMPVGADPHDFQASAQQVAQIGEADVLIVNGAGFEEGLLDVIEASEADGVPVFEAISAVETIEFGEGGHDHADEGHADEDHADEDHDGHDHEGADPHFFTDPARMALAADAIADFLVANVDGIDAEALSSSAAAYVDELEALDSEVDEMLAAIDADDRVLLTDHEVFGYFADRFVFEVVGTVIPSGSTTDGTSAQALAELAELIEEEGVPAIFADTSSSDELVQTLASEVGDVAVVELYSESLGADDSDGGTYLDMVRTNARRIVDAVAG
ncbi:MAG: metal ABC transporter substrate-binding protein [Acidimicrobiales bacterium]